MEETPSDIADSMCRLCAKSLESKEVASLFDNEKFKECTSLSDKIYICSSLEVSEGDGLSRYICGDCLHKLNQSFLFRNQCIAADITLRQLVSANVTEVPEKVLDVKLEDSDSGLTTDDSPLEPSHSDPEKEDRTARRRRASNQKYANQGTETPERNLRKARQMKCGAEEKENRTTRAEIKASSKSKPSCEKERKEDLDGRGNTVRRRGRKRKYNGFTHDKVKPVNYVCQYCQKMYPSEGGWRYHIHTVHNESYQPFICDLCGKAFKVKKNLEGHKNSIHFHLKQHLCDLCGRGFASKYALKVHKIWHNDEKDFTCDVCNAKFRTRGKMNTHRAIHGGPKKFMCEVCSRDFRWKKDFEIHMRTHTGEKPYSCCHCAKAFSSLANMKKHERNHVGEQPRAGRTTRVDVPEELPFEVDFTVIEMNSEETSPV